MLERLQPYFEEELPLLRTPRTIQILLVRQTHDFTIFRTEESRELNVVTLPHSFRHTRPETRVVMLASKQKAAETRRFAELAKALASEAGVELDEQQTNCSLKDDLCRKCPRCTLFGAVSIESGQGADRWNIRHRIEYASAFSVEPYEMVSEMLTFNAVNERTQSTGQALGYTENVGPLVHFGSVISLVAPTRDEFLLILRTLLSTKEYGAETRTRGGTVNYILGVLAGWEEIMTSLEWTLELAERDKAQWGESAGEMVARYLREAAFPDKALAITGDELARLLEEVRTTAPDIASMYRQSETFSRQVEALARGVEGENGRGRRRR
ncbi:MAG: type I-D CRISPR-associated protein Cas7/Csc2 [Candidatus Methanomethyliaceae archaeon]